MEAIPMGFMAAPGQLRKSRGYGRKVVSGTVPSGAPMLFDRCIPYSGHSRQLQLACQIAAK
jgi:hypothetical protein